MKKTEKNFNQKNLSDNIRIDPNRETVEYPTPAVCTECGALYTNGHWNWNDIPEQVTYVVCPACRRIKDQLPVSIIQLEGPFFHANKTKILKLIQQIQRKETSGHPLERIIEIREHKEHAEITTTGINLARHIGETLFGTYKGNLTYNYNKESLLRVCWKR